MSQKKQARMEEQQTNNSKGKKYVNRRKLSEVSGELINGESKELLDAFGESEQKPLHSSMELLQMTKKPSKPIVSRKAAGSNWESITKRREQGTPKTFEQESVSSKSDENHLEVVALTKSARVRQKRRAAEQKYVAMDCEMVGVGVNGQDDMLARVSIVNKRGVVLLDKFVKPQETVTDYRTSISGIRPHNINGGEDFVSVQQEVVQMLQGKTLVGHALCNDLAVLRIKHPKSSIRDTSRYKPLSCIVSNGHTPSLKRLTQAVLGKEIQTGEHNSVEDARAAMSIYNILAKHWEAHIRKRQKYRSALF